MRLVQHEEERGMKILSRFILKGKSTAARTLRGGKVWWQVSSVLPLRFLMPEITVGWSSYGEGYEGCVLTEVERLSRAPALAIKALRGVPGTSGPQGPVKSLEASSHPH